MDQAKAPRYSNEDLRFRRAYIRERLAALTAERRALEEERLEVNAKLGIPSRAKPKTLPDPVARLPR